MKDNIKKTWNWFATERKGERGLGEEEPTKTFWILACDFYIQYKAEFSLLCSQSLLLGRSISIV